MNYKHCCVVGAKGFYREFALVLPETQQGGTVEDKVQGYELLPGETLIDALPPVGLVKPKWQDSTWKEAATAAEIAAWEKAHPAPPVPPPTENERLRADVDFLAAMGGVAL